MRTLYCNGYLDIAGIIVEQPDLQIVGIYGSGDCDDCANTLEHLYAIPELNSMIPTLIAFERISFVRIFNTMAIYPTFSTNGSYPWRAVAESIDRDLTYATPLERSAVVEVRIYLRDFSEMTLVHRLMEEMVQNFPAIESVRFLFQNPLQAVNFYSELSLEFELITKTIQPLGHPDLSTILAFITPLKEVVFRCWDERENECLALSNEVKFAQAEAWTIGCPNLRRIAFLDRSTLERDADQEWKESRIVIW